ncbi:hypothetical protein NYE44_24295 [Paenibacillus sp. FSL L8-0493]|uniref:hypothetical protein n=1 Tax=unclassified Paenibacillus TaxID=185978 RepID=UPI0030F606EC
MYNFVFYNDSFKDLDRLFFLDIEELSNMKIVKRERLFRFKFLNFLCKFHLSHRVNSKINLPLKWIWNKVLFKNDFVNEDELCFVFTPGWYYPNFIEYLKKRYKTSKFVFYFSDTIESKLNVIPSLNIDYLKESFDLVLSYNQQDVKKYNLKYTSIYYSKMPQSWIGKLPLYDQVDVLFIGAARNRLNEIRSAYKKLTNAGLKCFFYVVSINSEHELNDEGIYYSKSAMPFREYLGRTMSAKCILEILDTNTTGCTLRFWEAVMYDKKLITNYKYAKDNAFYNPLNMHYFSSVDEIRTSFITEENEVHYNYKGENSPRNFLELIENYLAEKV